MKFKNNHNESIEITPVGWDPTEDWLFIKVKGESSGSIWEGRDPCLQSSEARELGSWLKSISENKNSKKSFLEPELEFHFNEGVLEIFLEWKFRPPWKPSDHDNDEKYSLLFRPGKKEINKQAKIWDSEINNVIK